jgi:hypothetical protein
MIYMYNFGGVLNVSFNHCECFMTVTYLSFLFKNFIVFTFSHMCIHYLCHFSSPRPHHFSLNGCVVILRRLHS